MNVSYHLLDSMHATTPPPSFAGSKRRVRMFALMLTALSVVHHQHASAQEPPSSELMSLAIENELLSTDAVDSRDLGVSADRGIVTLSGTVDSLRAKQHATRLAKLIRGVQSVINQMIVEPGTREDELLTLDVEQALTQNSATESYEVLVAVQNGIAHLGGNVDSHAEKRLAADVASGVAGIREVDNRLKVQSPDQRPDKELRAEVEGLIGGSARLEDAEITTSLENGSVVLTGEVGALIERDIAEELASVNGVKSVDVRGLRINPSIRNGQRRIERYKSVTDDSIAEAVRLTLRHDPRVLSFADQINVESRNAVVTLRGKVGHALARQAANESAQNTLGVDRVRDRLQVEWSGDDINDEQIAEYVRQALIRDAYVGRRDLIVRSRRAHVDLFGQVESQFEKQAAEYTANSQRGVVHVNNHLTVTDEWEPRSDEEIQEAIAEKLKWAFFDRANDIKVRVDNGVALLRGTVQTRRQWQRVMDIAVEAGARRPHNQLRIQLRPQSGRTPLYVPTQPGGEPPQR
ncbi:MAG: BON domain-containing protein [Fuerstiella sp.]